MSEPSEQSQKTTNPEGEIMTDREVPYWAYDLLIAMLDYEDAHGDAHDGWTCFRDTLNAVPAEARDAARTIDAYRRQKPMGEPHEPSAGETGGREVMSAADEARAYLSTEPTTPTWFGRALVTRLLAEHDAATARAETAERELAEMRERIGTEREEWAIRTAAGAEAFCATRKGALRIAGEWSTRFRDDGPWRAEGRVVGEWKAADGG